MGSLLLISGFPCSFFCIFWHLPLQLSFLVPLLPSQVYLLLKPWSWAAQICSLTELTLALPQCACRQGPFHSCPKLPLTPWSSFLVESNLLLVGLMGLCEAWDWLPQLLSSFRGPSIRTINSSPSRCNPEERCSYHSISACFTCKSACLHFAFSK